MSDIELAEDAVKIDAAVIATDLGLRPEGVLVHYATDDSRQCVNKGWSRIRAGGGSRSIMKTGASD